MLLRYTSDDPRKSINHLAVLNLATLAKQTPHLWTTPQIQVSFFLIILHKIFYLQLLTIFMKKYCLFKPRWLGLVLNNITHMNIWERKVVMDFMLKIFTNNVKIIKFHSKPSSIYNLQIIHKFTYKYLFVISISLLYCIFVAIDHHPEIELFFSLLLYFFIYLFLRNYWKFHWIVWLMKVNWKSLVFYLFSLMSLTTSLLRTVSI